jgi:hypothetical protein
MALTSKGKNIMKAMKITYGSKEKAESVFYEMIKKRRLSGVEEINDKYGSWKPDALKRDGKGRKKKDG